MPACAKSIQLHAVAVIAVIACVAGCAQTRHGNPPTPGLRDAGPAWQDVIGSGGTPTVFLGTSGVTAVAGHTGTAGHDAPSGNIGMPSNTGTAGSIATAGNNGTPAAVGIDGAPSFGIAGTPYPASGGVGVTGVGGFAGQAGGPYPFTLRPILYPTDNGGGPCGATQLEYVIDEIDQMNPELAAITVLANREQTAASAIFAFATADGFHIVFRRGDGDCVSGCGNEYWYYDTNEACVPAQVGYYRRVWNNSCYEQSGTPMWDLPATLDPNSACDAPDAG